MFQRFSILVLMCAIAVPVWAFKAYVYTEDTQAVLAGSDNVRRIEFNNGAVTLITSDGGTQTVDAGKWAKILPRLIDVSSAEGKLGGKPALRFADNTLVVAAASEITSVSVYNMRGEAVFSVAPRDTEVCVNLDLLPAGVYVATVAAGTDSGTLKFVKH